MKRIDKGVKLLLTDISDGMLAAAKSALGQSENISMKVVNIENIPYENDRFDTVTANMMLYHVSDIDKALSEAARVLSKNGSFYCAAHGENGINSFIADLLKDYGIVDAENKSFTLQNGYMALKKHFSDVKRFDYEDSLRVTDINDLIAYIYSLQDISSVTEIRKSDMKKALEDRMKDCVISIPKEYGMFVCKKQVLPYQRCADSLFSRGAKAASVNRHKPASVSYAHQRRHTGTAICFILCSAAGTSLFAICPPEFLRTTVYTKA